MILNVKSRFSLFVKRIFIKGLLEYYLFLV